MGLSPTEFRLLRYLMLNRDHVLSKDQILDYVWEYDFEGNAAIVETYIGYLRRKLGGGRRRQAPNGERRGLHTQVLRAHVTLRPRG